MEHDDAPPPGETVEVRPDRPTRLVIRRKARSDGDAAAAAEETLVLDDPALGFLADAACALTHADGSTGEATTDAQGRLKLEPRGAWVDVRVETPLGARALRVMFCRDPASSARGAWQRLVNLGYAGPAPSAEPDDLELAAAVQEFQSEVGLEPTGDLDAPTADKLAAVADDAAPWQSWQACASPSPDGAAEDPKLRHC